MNRKDILELKRRFKKEECTFTKLCGCYVNGEKNKLLEFRQTFLNIEKEEFFKYLEISRKVLSGGIGNNLLELDFPLDDKFENKKQGLLMQLKSSSLKDDHVLRKFYDTIIEHYDYVGNFLIVVFHDAYDVMTKTSDNIQLDESEEVYEYILCAICPVTLTKPGLGYFEVEKEIKARIRDWVVEDPSVGFVYPAFIDRSSDVNALMYYTKNAKEPHEELMMDALGCAPKQTATIQKETFQSIITSAVGADEELSEQLFIDIQENLNTMIEEYNDLYEDIEVAPIALSKERVKQLLVNSGVSEEATAKIEASFEENFGDDVPLAESLVDVKVIKANAQKKKEDQLIKQVEKLEQELEEVTRNAENEKLMANDSGEKQAEDAVVDQSDNQADDLEDNQDDNQEDVRTSEYDVVLHVKPEKLPMIKTTIIDGQRCLVVPMNEDEQATINGMKDLF